MTVLLLSYIDSLQKHGNWCGEIHVQWSTYLAQELSETPSRYNFILYRNSPFSYDLRDELIELRANQLIQYVTKPYPYNPGLTVTDAGKKLMKNFPVFLEEFGTKLDEVAQIIGDKGAYYLALLSMAVYATKEAGPQTTIEEKTRQLLKYREYISFEDAQDAIREIDAMREVLRA